MKEQEENKVEEVPAQITPWYILELLKPIIREEFIADCRFDREGIRMKFCNGQRFHISVREIK